MQNGLHYSKRLFKKHFLPSPCYTILYGTNYMHAKGDVLSELQKKKPCGGTV